MHSSNPTDRSKIVTKALAAADAKPDAERVRIPWRTGDHFATVVELPVEKVVLNPRSHRIRAQLESSPFREVIQSDPFGDEAQKAIAAILKDTDEFDDLRKNLADVGQIEPGVVTAEGLLVNANTRCVALRENEKRYIRAAVLPSDASQEEIDRLELRLQMKRDFRSDYTFTNELLFIEDLFLQYKLQAEEIAREMGWASRSDGKLARKAEQANSYLRMLSIIREIQRMSGDRIKIVSFDSKRQALIELDEEYEKLKRNNYPASLELRNARLVGILAGAGYRELREIDQNFLEKYLVPALDDREQLQPYVHTLTTASKPIDDELEGLDLLEDTTPAGDASDRSSEALLDLLTRTAGDETVSLTTVDGDQHELNRGVFCSELLSAIEGAAEDVRIEREAGDQLNRPRELIRKATKHVQAAIDAYREVSSLPDYDDERMRVAVDDLGGAHGALVKVMAEGARER
jgi:hypothetical protein